MERVYEIAKYFPRHIPDATLQKYIEHHIASLIKCAENELYSSAYSHLHLLYMSFVYLQILRISEIKEEEFRLCWIGFPDQEKEFLREPTSPFSFSKINEKSVFRFFRLLGLNDGNVGNLSSLVNSRNKRLHASGILYCEREDEFENELAGYLEKIDSVLSLQLDFLSPIYKQLVGGYESDFVMTNDEIESNFEDQYHFSSKELSVLAEDQHDIASTYLKESYL